MRFIVRPIVWPIVQFKRLELGKVSHRDASQSLAVAVFCKSKGLPDPSAQVCQAGLSYDHAVRLVRDGLLAPFLGVERWHGLR